MTLVANLLGLFTFYIHVKLIWRGVHWVRWKLRLILIGVVLLLILKLVTYHNRLLLWNEVFLEQELLIISFISLQYVIQVDLVSSSLLGRVTLIKAIVLTLFFRRRSLSSWLNIGLDFSKRLETSFRIDVGSWRWLGIWNTHFIDTYIANPTRDLATIHWVFLLSYIRWFSLISYWDILGFLMRIRGWSFRVEILSFVSCMLYTCVNIFPISAD